MDDEEKSRFRRQYQTTDDELEAERYEQLWNEITDRTKIVDRLIAEKGMRDPETVAAATKVMETVCKIGTMLDEELT